MNWSLVNESGNTKMFKLYHEGRSIELALNYVGTRNVVQVSYLLCSFEGKITKWKPYGSFNQLIETKIGYKIEGTRQKFIDQIYHSNPAV